MMIRWQTFEQYHNRHGVGSTRLRVHNLMKYWDGSGLYKYGEKPDVFIFQKVYCTYDYKFPKHYKAGIKILDVCDTDWVQTVDLYIKETLDAMDGIVVPTKNMQKLLQTMTDKPVKIIKDRFDLSEFPKPKVHSGELQSVVWFGYSHNAELLRFAVPSLEIRNIRLTVISNEDPAAYRWATKPDEYVKNYTYIKYNQEALYEQLQGHDACALPKGYRPEDKYKSENKTVIAQLCGLPVVTDAEGLEAMQTSEARNESIKTIYDTIRQEYDVLRSIEEYKEFIEELRGKTSEKHG